jgi:hypothetical protein
MPGRVRHTAVESRATRARPHFGQEEANRVVNRFCPACLAGNRGVTVMPT